MFGMCTVYFVLAFYPTDFRLLFFTISFRLSYRPTMYTLFIIVSKQILILSFMHCEITRI